jgi:hypothetical protein
MALAAARQMHSVVGFQPGEVSMRAGAGSLLMALVLSSACAGEDDGSDDGATDDGTTDDGTVDDDGTTDDGTVDDDGTTDDDGSDGDDGVPLEPVEICDGGDGLRLAARFEDGGFFGSPATTIPGANGAVFLYIDGNCQAWLTGVRGLAMSLTLSPDEADALTVRLGVSSWQDFAGGEWSGTGFDEPTLTLWQPTGKVVCQRGCAGGDLPEPLSLVAAALLDEIDRLSADAEILDGPMRVMAIPGIQSPTFLWAYEPPIASFADPGGPDSGVEPGLVQSYEATTALRAAWILAMADGLDGLPTEDAEGSNLTYLVFARDVLPFETDDAWGGVELP